MLPQAHRLRRPEQFRAVLRGRRTDARIAGGRAGGTLMTVHLARRPASEGPREARLGLIVSTAVGNAVVRHRTSRRLRHLVAARLAELPERTDLVIRAHPAAGAATSAQLGSELDALLARASSQARRRGTRE